MHCFPVYTGLFSLLALLWDLECRALINFESPLWGFGRGLCSLGKIGRQYPLLSVKVDKKAKGIEKLYLHFN